MIRKIAIYTMFIVGLITIHNTLYGQMSQGGVPYSFESDTFSGEVPVIQMTEIDESTIDSIKTENDTARARPYQFAYGFDVNIDVKDSSRVDSLDIGLLHRLKIVSDSAKSINLIFDKYHLPAGAKLFIYSEDQEDVKGAFTSGNNKESQILPILPVKGHTIVIEYFQPYSPEFEGELTIGKLSHDFIGIIDEDDNFGNSGNCHVDINCPEGTNWQVEKRSVCRILINGSGLCTGTLLNNTANDGTPYFLTANHCISSQSTAQNSVYVFNYESPTCNGGDGSVAQSISGGNLIATQNAQNGSDFTLLELALIPWSNYNPFYAGWDRTDNQGAGGVSIHHPAGDVKKISTHNEVPTNSTCVNQDYWLIDDWLQTANGHGVTEDGSSGGPLFNDNHHVIGQLLGGCSGHNENCDNPDNDWSNFGKIWASWNGNNASERLRDWLNPQNNVTTLDGIDACNEGTQVNLNITHTITSSSSELHQATNNITASNIVESGATATYEAENQIQLTDGFTAENGSDFVARIEGFDCLLTCSRINLYSWTDNVCQGDDLCFNVLNADGYSITVDDGGTQIFQDSGNINSTSVCVWNTSGVSTGNYTVTVTFSENCNNTEISNTYQVSVNSCKKSTEVSSHDSSTQQVTSVSETTEEDFKVKVIPNPSDGNFTIDLSSQPSKPYLLELIDGRGSVLHHVEHLNATKINVEQSGLPVGTYFVRIQTGTKKVVKKVIIQ